MELNVNLYDCAHCKGEGSCTNGPNGEACSYCAKILELKGKESRVGIPCGVCAGLGKTDNRTERIIRRTPSFIALLVVFILLALVGFAMWDNSEFFSQVLTFSSTLIGIILTSYFSNKS